MKLTNVSGIRVPGPQIRPYAAHTVIINPSIMTKSKIYFLFKVTFLPLFRVELWAGFYGNFSESIHEGHCAMATFWEK